MKNFKVMMMTLMMCLMVFSSCEKEELEDPNQQCNCGVVANDGITNNCYWLEIRNDCTGNKKQFCFDQDFWFNNYPGDRVCVRNQPQW